ncbi:MAG: hypothetical protein KL863_05545 [Rhizobium sp.]|nr:hypothetical protein [Rhizobium sp.]
MLQEIYDLLMKAFHAATEEMASFKFDRYKPVDRTIAALYATIYEEVDTAICLYDAKKYTGAQLVLRPLLEAHVDLVAIIKDPGYVEFMEASHDHEWLRFLRNGFKGTNPFLQTFWNNIDVQNEIAAIESRLDGFKKNKVRPLHVAERFARADMIEEYESIYNDLCCQTHNNLRALIRRHIEIDDQQKTFQLVINAKPPEESIGSLLDGLLGFILSSSIFVHRHFNSQAVKRFEDLDVKRSGLLKNMQATP